MASIAGTAQPTTPINHGEDLYIANNGASVGIYFDPSGNLYLQIVPSGGTPIWYLLTIP